MPVVSGGSGSSVVKTATATLTNTQIRALPTTSGSAPFGLEFLASPGPNTVLLPLSGLIVKYGAAYTNVNAAAFFVLAHSGFDGTNMTPQIQCGAVGLLDTPVDTTATLPMTGWNIVAAATPSNIFPTGNPSNLTAQSGRGLILFADNAAAGDFTGGGASNHIDIHLLYAVLPV